MKNFYILTPAFNDWKSLNKLLISIDKSVYKLKGNFTVIVVNDASTIKAQIKLKNLRKLKKIIVITNKKNLGSQKSIFIGLNYLKKIKSKSIIVVMDSDGEDDPKKITKLISIARKNPKSIVTGNRLSRKENMIYNFLYKFHLMLTFLLTGKYINFGNFSSFSSENLKNFFLKPNQWLAYSATVARNFNSVVPFYISKKKRYYDKSKVNYLMLFGHSINIISVFRVNVFKSSILIIFVLLMINIFFSNIFIYFIILFLTLLNIFINIDNKKKNIPSNYLNLVKSIKKYKS